MVCTSAIFVLLYLHVVRCIIYAVVVDLCVVVFVVGVVVFGCLVVAAFMGYVLPGSQMSY